MWKLTGKRTNRPRRSPLRSRRRLRDRNRAPIGTGSVALADLLQRRRCVLEERRAVVVENEKAEFDWSGLAEWVNRRRNPLIFGAVALVVLATIGSWLRRSTLEDSPRKVEIGRTLGLAALDEGRFDDAHKYLAKAAHAVNAPGGRVEGADEVRQGAKEAELLTSLVSETLETLLARADPADTSTWPADFDKLYKGRSIIIDATVVRVPVRTGRRVMNSTTGFWPKAPG